MNRIKLNELKAACKNASNRNDVNIISDIVFNYLPEIIPEEISNYCGIGINVYKHTVKFFTPDRRICLFHY